MNMVGDGFDIVVNVRIEVRTRLPMITPALDHVEQMRNDTGLNETLASLVKVDSPGIAGAFGKYFEDFFGGMITPYAGIDASPFAVGRSRFADVGVRKHSMTSVKPAIRSPGKSVE